MVEKLIFLRNEPRRVIDRRSKHAELERKRQDVKATEEMSETRRLKMLDALAERVTARAALRKYGVHRESCDLERIDGKGRCNCGLFEALGEKP